MPFDNPAALLEWQVFHVELARQPGLEPDNFKALLDGKNGLDGKIESLERKLNDIEVSMRRKEIVLKTWTACLSATISTVPNTSKSAMTA